MPWRTAWQKWKGFEANTVFDRQKNELLYDSYVWCFAWFVTVFNQNKHVANAVWQNRKNTVGNLANCGHRTATTIHANMGLIKAKSETAAGTKCASNWTSRWAENQKKTIVNPVLWCQCIKALVFNNHHKILLAKWCEWYFFIEKMCLTTGAKHAKPSANHALGGTKVHTSVPKIEMSETKHERTCKSAGLPACLIGKCCFCFCFWFVLVPLFCCYAFLVRLNRVHPPSTPVLWTLSVYLADRLYTRPTKCCFVW